MELRIGENIKRLRKSKGLTQEQFAGLLNISCAAVSKWETCDSLPDISMIFPIATVFEVSIDELMGFDEKKIKEEATQVINDYNKLNREGKWQDASKLLFEARKKYPNDFQIMMAYIYSIIGGSADNSSDVLNANHDEILGLCNCILDSCTMEGIRLEAMTVKAKLLHAAGETEKALEILHEFPNWYQSSSQKTEQLYAKDSSDFRYWIRRNLYELADFTANKAIKNAWYDSTKSEEARITRSETIGDAYKNAFENTGEGFFAVSAEMSYAELASKLTFYAADTLAIIRLRKKQLSMLKILRYEAKSDNLLHEYPLSRYQTDDPSEWLKNYLKTAPQFENLRKNLDFCTLFE